ncbi:MAG: hypothetical protein U1F36_01110 [Planctomycetota bacterium]
MVSRLNFAGVLLSLACSAPAQEQIRFDAARFTAPTGWTRVDSAGHLTLRAEAGDATIDVVRSVAMPVSIEERGGELVEEAKKQPGFRMEIEPESGRHRVSRGRWHRFVYSRTDQEHEGKFIYETVLSVAAGGRCMTFRMETGTTAAYEAHRVEFGAMVDGVVMTSGQRLESGETPLTRYMVDEAADFLGWLVQSPLTDEQRAMVESELRKSWRAGDREEIEGARDLLTARDQLAQLPEEQRELAREAVLKEALDAWRADTEGEGAKMMLAIHEAAHQPLCAGEPPLTRQAVDAFAEFLTFAAGRTIDYDAKLPKEIRDELAKSVAEGYADLPKEQRELIAGMPLTWAALRVAWPDLPAEQRDAYVQGWKNDAAIANLAKALSAQKAAADKAREAAEGYRDLAHRQAMLHASQMQFQAMQNVMRMQMETARIMASNMGGNTRWVYRW